MLCFVFITVSVQSHAGYLSGDTMRDIVLNYIVLVSANNPLNPTQECFLCSPTSEKAGAYTENAHDPLPYAGQLLGARVQDRRYTVIQHTITTPKGTPPSGEYEKTFIKEAKFDGMADKTRARTRANILRHLHEDYPDYQRFKPADFDRLSDIHLRGVMASFVVKLDTKEFVPESFTAQYGDRAEGETMLALVRAAKKRGKPEFFLTGILNSGLNDAAKNPDKPINSDIKVVSSELTSTPVTSTAPRLLNFKIGQEIMLRMNKNDRSTTIKIVVPQDAIDAAIVANNLPADLKKYEFPFDIADEAAFMAGYAARAGASREIGPLSMTYQDGAVCALSGTIARLANSNQPNIPAIHGWAAGYI